MDETTINDIRQRVARWLKGSLRDKPEDPKTWIFAINVDDVQMLLDLIEGLERQNADLREQLKAHSENALRWWGIGVDEALPGADKTVILRPPERKNPDVK